MAQQLASLTIGSTWTDVAVQTGYTTTAGASTLLQALSNNRVLVYFSSSASQPAGLNDGFAISQNQSIQGTAAHIWVRADGAAQIAVGLTD